MKLGLPTNASAPDAVFGNAITSRIVLVPPNSATIRSNPGVNTTLAGKYPMRYPRGEDIRWLAPQGDG
jgi:hypothetical protein